MKKLFIILVLFILITPFGNAIDFKSGYIINLNNDTLYGKIGCTNYYEHSQKCIFKESDIEESRIYLPDQLIGYRFNEGKYYVSKIIMIDSIPTYFFLEYLINAKINFYFRQEKGLVNHYYTEKDASGLKELIFINEIVQNQEGMYQVTKKKYIGLLNYLTSDCQLLQSDIAKINEPAHKNLIKLGKRYNDLTCPDNACIIYEKIMPVKIKFELSTSTDFFRFSQPLQSYGFNVLFSNTKISEKAYIGLGILYNPIFGNNWNNILISPLQIPLSINYIDSKSGFSPLFSIALDLNTFGGLQSYNAGVKYQIKKISFNLTSQVQTTFMILPYSAGLKFGLMYDL